MCFEQEDIDNVATSIVRSIRCVVNSFKRLCGIKIKAHPMRRKKWGKVRNTYEGEGMINDMFIGMLKEGEKYVDEMNCDEYCVDPLLNGKYNENEITEEYVDERKMEKHEIMD